MKKAFTLIELLVVMAIIAILTSLIVGGFRTSQIRSRDAQRKSDLKQTANALELYYSDHGKYPDTLPAPGSEFTDGKTTYFRIMPSDPTGLTYLYRIPDSPTNQKYQLYAHLENSQDKNVDSAIIARNFDCGQTCNFSVTSANTTPQE